MKELIEKLFSGKTQLVFNVHAEEGGTGGTEDGEGGGKEPPKKPEVNYEDLIAKARKEEKDKLYPKISALEGERDGYIKKCNEHLITIGQKDAEIEALNKKLKESGKDDSEVVKGLKAEIDKLKGELETAKKNAPDEKAIEERIKAEYEIKLYRTEKIAEFKDEIIPELIMGTTKEEIDASLETSKKRFKEMSEKILKGVNTNIPPANINSSKFNMKDFTLEDLAKLDPRSPEYKEFRKKMGLK